MQDYGLNLDYTRSKPPEKKPYFLIIVFLVFFLIPFLGFIKRSLANKQTIVSPLPDIIVSFFSQKPKDNQELINEVKKITETVGGTWAVYYYNLNDNHGFGINETMIFDAASVNKIPILASLYYLADKGEINLEKQITLQKEDIQDYGTGSIRYDPPGTTYSVKTLARLMMKKSDNTAAYILARQIIGLDRIQQLINDWGLTQTSINKDQSSLVDMAKLLKKMFKGEVTNQALTSEMLGSMDNSDFEDRIPALLPKQTKVYHKIGNTIGGIHDVGIINLENRPYILGVFTSDVNDEKEAIKTIATISRIFFDFVK